MNRQSFILCSLGTTLALPGLPSLLAKSVGSNSAVQLAKGVGIRVFWQPPRLSDIHFASVSSKLGCQWRHNR